VLGILGAAGEYGQRALVHAPGSLPAGQFVGWLGDLMALPAVGLLAGALPQLFPTGQPVSRRWRPLQQPREREPGRELFSRSFSSRPVAANAYQFQFDFVRNNENKMFIDLENLK
jgi:hypothetical protein